MDESHTPLVSVYITNHNYAPYVEQAIQSVLRQTLRDFELIVIDDGSTDDSRAILERYAGHDRVVVIFQHNQGLTVTNNIALRAARGKYVIRLDADDYLDENALQLLAGALERDPALGLVFPDYYLVDADGVVLEHVRRHDFSEVTLLDQPAHGACTMIRRDLLLQLGGYDESFSCHDGYDLWIRLIAHARVQNVNLPLFYYRQHERSLTRDEQRIIDTRSQILAKQADRNGRRLSAAAVIPVRGSHLDPGSLALRRLADRPLIEWTLDAALDAQRISSVLVTSPDEQVLAHVAARYGRRVLCLRRDSRLALPNTHVEETLLHTLEHLGPGSPAPDALVVLYIESPLREPRYIDNALDVMELFDTDAVISVRPDTGVLYRHAGAGLEPLRQSRRLRLEREELFRECGQIYAVRRTHLVESKQLVSGRVGHVVIDPRSAVRLQSEWDWQLAEQIIALSRQTPAESAV